MLYFLSGVAATLAMLLAFRVFGYRSLFAYEVGVLARRGRTEVVGPGGAFWFVRLFDKVVVHDVRERATPVPNQEIVCADGVPVKLAAVVAYSIAEPRRAFVDFASVDMSLYAAVQFALRAVAGTRNAEDVVAQRDAIDAELRAKVEPEATRLGLALAQVRIRDIMLPGEWKRANLQRIVARQEGEALLERARGETAALRSLANAARMLADNPNLLHLRTLQAVTALAQGKGNTVVLGVPDGVVPVPRAARNNKGSDDESA